MNRDIVLIGIFMLGIIGGIVGFALFMSSLGCSATAEAMGVKYKWSIMTNCMIEDGDKWVPLKNYRDIRN